MPRPAPRFVILRMLATSLPYTDRATLLAATPLVGATGYVASYAAPSEVWQYTAGGWALLAAEWDGVSSGQEVSDLLAVDGVDGGAWVLVGRQWWEWDGSVWRVFYTLDQTTSLTFQDAWAATEDP